MSQMYWHVMMMKWSPWNGNNYFDIDMDGILINGIDVDMDADGVPDTIGTAMRDQTAVTMSMTLHMVDL